MMSSREGDLFLSSVQYMVGQKANAGNWEPCEFSEHSNMSPGTAQPLGLTLPSKVPARYMISP